MKHKDTHSWGRETAGERYGLTKLPETPALSRTEQAPQAPEDRHSPGYDNDASGWVRGEGKQSPYPHFDKKGAWRTGKVEDNS